MLASFITRRPRGLLVAVVVLFGLLTVVATGTLNSLSLNRYENAHSESASVRADLAATFGTGSPNVAVLVTAADGDVRAPAAATAAARLTDELAAHPAVAEVRSFWQPGSPDTLASKDFRYGLILAVVPGDANQVRRDVLPGIETDLLRAADPAITLTLGGADEVFRDVAAQAATDFLRAELIVIPLVLLLLWVVLRRWALALVTIGIGVFCVVAALALLRVATMFVEISTFAANIALVLGIGLGVDYGLFMIYRFREELGAGAATADAVRSAVRGAGRTIVFSAATVGASLAVLLAFPFPFLASFAYAGIAVAAVSVLAAVVILPAALRLLGHRAMPRRPAGGLETGFWFRAAQRVIRRPVLASAAALLVLAALGAPALGVNFGPPDDRVLRAQHPVRSMYDTIRADFATEEADALQVYADAADPGALPGYAAALSSIPGVYRVDSAAGSFAGGVVDGPPSVGMASDAATWLRLVPTGERLVADPVGLVAEIRSMQAPFEVRVGGYPAELADYRDGVAARLPLVALLIMFVTYAVLFLMTGSVLAPLKAAVLNMVSMSVMFGVLVWGFQNGALAGILGFTPTGSIEPSIPILMFCVAYGLSMDYEVFLLSRIKEDYDRTADPVGSIPRGIARSAPLVTAAALIMAVSFAVYGTGEVVFLQQLGLGMALTVAVDATVVRGVLAPALMRLAGRANWWAPRPLRKWHDRIGLREQVGPEPAVGREDLLV
ncbi:putative drug exporter of the RND superfamily [Nocardia amikacinitolerans]|uniref:Putative drug exporter of the RND superfamily n=1 Tax=Nocardia amikacinitolerans TaxID=756689 RepID=A0A285LYR8_9NOCA|nr:MMPL family transporter [Nocardia amikacinitolerans]SNY89603.1 putative drug exporter of the RND superfamily [Nocardia amikacinitolerans]